MSRQGLPAGQTAQSVTPQRVREQGSTDLLTVGRFLGEISIQVHKCYQPFWLLSRLELLYRGRPPSPPLSSPHFLSHSVWEVLPGGGNVGCGRRGVLEAWKRFGASETWDLCVVWPAYS